jgi:hypothetical protein
VGENRLHNKTVVIICLCFGLYVHLGSSLIVPSLAPEVPAGVSDSVGEEIVRIRRALCELSRQLRKKNPPFPSAPQHTESKSSPQ